MELVEPDETLGGATFGGEDGTERLRCTRLECVESKGRGAGEAARVPRGEVEVAVVEVNGCFHHGWRVRPCGMYRASRQKPIMTSRRMAQLDSSPGRPAATWLAAYGLLAATLFGCGDTTRNNNGSSGSSSSTPSGSPPPGQLSLL